MSRSAEIGDNLAAVQARIVAAAASVGRQASEIELIVVTKNFPPRDVQILYELGLRNFGENRDQEGAEKFQQLPTGITWHFQGQIQSRKITSIANWASTVHSLDSLEHARKFAALTSRSTKEFFVQVNLEPTRIDRGGVPLDTLPDFLTRLSAEGAITPVGLMTVAPRDMEAIEAFADLQAAQRVIVDRFPTVTRLSMGMSGDFEAAIRAGATHLRIGSSILGSRGLPA